MEFSYFFSSKDILNCLYFSYDVAMHTYQRLSKSKVSFNLHIERIFTGKLGEYALFQILNKFTYEIDYKDAFKIWEGTQNVDRFDLKVNNKTIDAKTLYKPNHRNMIVPLDQWKSMPKDFYVAVKLDNFDNILNETMKNISLLKHPTDKKEFENNFNNLHKGNEMQAIVLGYLPRISDIWIVEERSIICPEHPCVRAPIKIIGPFEDLLKSL